MKRNGKKMLALILCTAVALHLSAAAAVHLGLDYHGAYSDNILLNASALKDYVSLLGVDLGMDWKKWNLYLDADAALYAQNPGFNSYTLEPGLEYVAYLKKPKTTAVYMGASLTSFRTREWYRDFNYTGPGFYGGIKFQPSPRFFIKTGYSFKSRVYGNYRSFDFLDHAWRLESDYLLAPQTTLRLKARAHYRRYPHVAVSFDGGDDYDYYGRGRGGSGGHGTQTPGSGPGFGGGGMGNHGGPTPWNGETLDVDIPSAGVALTVIQGLGVRMGITAEVEYRRLFQGLEDAESLVKNAYTLYPQNDDLLWQGMALGLSFRAVPSGTLSLGAGISYLDKSYPGIYTRDEVGEVVQPAQERKDSLVIYRLLINKRFGKIELGVRLFYRRNDSTDPFFVYRGLDLAAGLAYSL